MREDDIDKKLAQRDKDLKVYIDMKIRAVKKLVAHSIWVGKNPKRALLIIFVFVLLCISIASTVDLKKFIAKKFGIELKE